MQATLVPQGLEESVLYPRVCQLLSRKGYTTMQCFPHGRYSPFEVDILGYKRDSGELYMVEVKLCHINKALKQGMARLPYSDFVSLAFPDAYAQYVSTKFRRDLQEKGFGLISIDGTAKELIAPRKSTRLKSLYKECIMRDVYRRFSLPYVMA